MRKIGLFIFIISCGFIFSENWKDLIPNLTDKDLNNIENGKYADRARADYKAGLELLPKNSSFQEEFMADLLDYNPELCVEMLFVIDKPNMDDKDLFVYILNNFRAFSEQAGLEYYSYNRKKMYPLIKKSYFVNENNKEISDPVVTSLPTYELHNYYQDDTTFSGNYYSLITRTHSDSIWLQMENLKELKVFGLFGAIDKGGERVNFLIRLSDNKILLYALAQIKEEPKIKKVLNWDVNIPGSFKRRMGTIVEWFQERIK